MGTSAFFHPLHEARAVLGGHHEADFLMVTVLRAGQMMLLDRKRAAIAMVVEFNLDDALHFGITEGVQPRPFIHSFGNAARLAAHANKMKQRGKAHEKREWYADKKSLVDSGKRRRRRSLLLSRCFTHGVTLDGLRAA